MIQAAVSRTGEVRECEWPLKGGIKRTKEFERKGLATHAVNVGLVCGNQCTYCSTAAMNRCHVAFKELRLHPFERGYAIIDPNTAARLTWSRPRLSKTDVIQVCTTTDAWSAEARSYGLGRKIIEFLLEKTPAQVRVLTKNAEVREDFDVMERHSGRVMVGFSTGIPQGREDMARAVEPNASPVADRLAALREAHERGIRTFGMPCPILPSVAESVDVLRGMFEELRECGVEDIWTESVSNRGRGLIHTAEALRQAGLDADADAVDAARSSAGWSASARKLIENAENAAKAAGVADRLKILLYPSKLTATDMQSIRETSSSVIWLG